MYKQEREIDDLIISVNNDIGFYNSGVETAEMKRVKLFRRYYIAGKLAFVCWDPKQHDYTKSLGISDDAYICLYDYIQHACHTHHCELHFNNLPFVNKDSQVSIDTGIVKNGGFCYYVSNFTGPADNNQIAEADVTYRGQMYRKLYYDSRGFLSRVKHYHLASVHSPKMYSESFLTPDGNEAMTMEYHRGYSPYSRYQPYYYIGDSVKPLVGKMALRMYFLNQLCKKYQKQSPVILVIDRWWNHKDYIDALPEITVPHYTVLCAHCSHLHNEFYPLTSSLDKWFKYVFQQAKKRADGAGFDAMIASTYRQTKDLRARFQPDKSLQTIPVGIQDPSGVQHPVPMSKRKPYQITCVTRVSSVEGLPGAVKAFCLAKDKIPQLKLDVYGVMGGIGDSLRHLIQRAEKKHHIAPRDLRLHSYTQHVAEAYRRAQLTLVSSKADSFNVSLLEALSQGVPAIVYNENYGPRDMIHSGADGYQVRQWDWQKMGQLIADYFRHPKLMQKLSDGAYRESNKFSPEHVARQWESLIKTADKEENCK